MEVMNSSRLIDADQPPATVAVSISSSDAGRPLGEIVAERLGIVGQQAAARGGLWLGQRRVAPETLAVPGATLLVRLPPARGYCDAPLRLDHIVYEDDDLLVIDKPPACYVNDTPWDTQGHVLAVATRLLAMRDGQMPTLHLAHRLDFGTSGLLIISKHPRANGPLQAAFNSGRVAKRYLAICTGEMPVEIELVTGHGRAAGGRWRLYDRAEIGLELPNGQRVKLAHTHFIRRHQYATAALVWAMPITGRAHQIRLHLAALGCPLLGDERYGGPTAIADLTLPHPLLHAAELTLPHPRDGRPMRLFSPPPPLFGAVVQRL